MVIYFISREFQGTLPDGQVVAVKRLTSPSGQGMKEFKSGAYLNSVL